MPISDEKIGAYLDHLAARGPAPGGCASAALQTAQAAALLGMVARYSTGGGDSEHRQAMERVIGETDHLRGLALRLADADADAFAALAGAYRMPRSTEAEQASRNAALAAALASAAWPAIQLINLASIIVHLAEALAAVGNPNVIGEIAAAAEAARSAVATARVTIELSLADIDDEQVSLEMIAQVGKAAGIITHAEQVTAAVREHIRG